MLEITCHNVLCYRLVWLAKSEEGWYLVQIFPAYVKGVAGSVATLVNWFSAYIVTMIFNYMLLWSAAGSFWIFAGECLLTIVFVALYVPETRGRTLEQIEASFK
jgi:SP family sugar porter-like MFS transporter